MGQEKKEREEEREGPSARPCMWAVGGGWVEGISTVYSAVSWAMREEMGWEAGMGGGRGALSLSLYTHREQGGQGFLVHCFPPSLADAIKCRE